MFDYATCFAEQGWRSGESTRLPHIWLEFDSRTRRHMWVEFAVGSRPGKLATVTRVLTFRALALHESESG